MSAPTKYTPLYSFSGYQANNPSDPLPAPRVDDELARVASSLGEVVDALSSVRRADGKLQNGSVTLDSIDNPTRVALSHGAIAAWQTVVAWAPGVTYTDVAPVSVVTYSGETYVCILAHTSVPTFDPTKWEKIAARGAAGSGMGDLMAANNLADVDDVNQARTNIGAAASTNPVFQGLSAGLNSLAYDGVSYVDAAIGQKRSFAGRAGGVDRWAWILGDDTEESGANAGARAVLRRFSDGGVALSDAIVVYRETGAVEFAHDVSGVTQLAGDSSTRFATTAFVTASFVKKNAPSFTGTASVVRDAGVAGWNFVSNTAGKTNYSGLYSDALGNMRFEARDKDNFQRVLITSSGASKVPGSFTADSFIGDGAGITNLPITPSMIVEDQKSVGTPGGAVTAGQEGAWNTRVLNEVVRNVITGASLTANLVTLPKGTYYATWSAPAAKVNQHKTQLYNATTAGSLGFGTSEYADDGNLAQTRSTGSRVFTLTATASICIRHYVTTASPTNGWGVSTGAGTEVYTRLEIWKVA